MSFPSSTPLSLRISVTDRCQLRCLYCMPAGGVPKAARRDILSFEEILCFVRALKSDFGLSKVRLTGGEPLVRAGVVDLVAMLADEGIRDLALTTNGQRLAGFAPLLRQAGLHRVNISLDSVDQGTYATLTRGGDLRNVLDGLRAAVECGLSPVKINTVVLRGWNDHELAEIARFAMKAGCRIRFLELMPIGCARSLFKDAFVSATEIRRRLEHAFTLEPLSYGCAATACDFLASDRSGLRGIIGFVSPRTEPFCDGCARLRLTSTGRLIACLASGRRLDIRRYLRADTPTATAALVDIVAAALRNKRQTHSFDRVAPMVTVGG